LDPEKLVNPSLSLEGGNIFSFRNIVFFRIPDIGQSEES
jgi:hypothetical protein